jgi:hypothetical protein
LENFPRRKKTYPPDTSERKKVDSRRHPRTDIGNILDMAGEKKKQQPVWLGYATLTTRGMRLNAKMTPVERLHQWQQHAVSQMLVRRGDFVLISVTAHPLDQTK